MQSAMNLLAGQGINYLALHRKYSQHLLDSSSSLGQLNQPRESKKSGFFGFKRKGAEKDGLDAMPSITEQSGTPNYGLSAPVQNCCSWLALLIVSCYSIQIS